MDSIEDFNELTSRDEVSVIDAQLEAISDIQLSKKINDNSYNNVIDQCNTADQEVAELFIAIANNDLPKVK